MRGRGNQRHNQRSDMTLSLVSSPSLSPHKIARLWIVPLDARKTLRSSTTSSIGRRISTKRENGPPYPLAGAVVPKGAPNGGAVQGHIVPLSSLEIFRMKYSSNMAYSVPDLPACQPSGRRRLVKEENPRSSSRERKTRWCHSGSVPSLLPNDFLTRANCSKLDCNVQYQLGQPSCGQSEQEKPPPSNESKEMPLPYKGPLCQVQNWHLSVNPDLTGLQSRR